MSKVSNATQVSLKEFASLVSTCGDRVTFIGQGEPGIGKSAMLKELSKMLPGHRPVFLDAALMDIGDMQMPNVENNKFSFLPNSMFVSDDGKPLLLRIDEFGKGTKPTKNAMLSLLQEHRIGNYWLPKGSRVFATTNLSTDGVGDLLEPHMRNRMCIVNIRKPSAGEWLTWACQNDIDSSLQAWVKEYPHCLASYTDGAADDNPYIFNPKKQQVSFVTPRSLEQASHILNSRPKGGEGKQECISQHALMAALAGTIGESAAHDFSAYLTVAEKNPPWDMIIKNPLTTEVPKDAIPQVILALGAATRIQKNEVSDWLDYLQRMEPEIQCLFAQQVLSNPAKVSWFVSSGSKFNRMVKEQNWLVTGSK